jgi:hypothetical protein
MKNKLKILSLVVIGTFLFTTCQKEPKLPFPTIQTGVIPVVKKDKTKDQSISFLNLAGFKATVILDVYYGEKPKSMKLMVVMNDSVFQTAVIKSDITTFPTSVDITTSGLVGKVPGLTDINQLKLGDKFKFYVDMTLQDGTVVEGNSDLYVNGNTSVANLPNSSLNVVYTVACALNPALITGSYHSVSLDWNSEGDISITADPGDPYKLYVKGLYTIEGGNEDKGPLVMHLDPLTYDVTADKTIIATDYFGYVNGTFAGKGTYDTCTGTYVMKLEISVSVGTFGEFTFTFTRN